MIAELKACKGLADDHISQLLGYLKASRIKHGLLINFGASRFQVRKFTN
jgi:GxxExxY protein